MPAKRYLLIAFALCVVVLSARITSWIYLSIYHLTTGASKSLTGYDLNKVVDAPVGKYNLEFENRLLYIDSALKHERLDRLVMRPILTLSRDWTHVFAKVYYRGELFDHSQDRDYLTAANLPYLKHTYNQQAGFSGEFDYGKFNGSLRSRHRTFYYDPKHDGEAKIMQANNFLSMADIGYKIIEPLTVFAEGSFRRATDPKTDIYDFKTAGVGLELNYRFDVANIVQASSRIDWLEGKRYSLGLDTLTYQLTQNTQRLIPITSALRYTKIFTPQVYGFLSYENRSFYDREQQEFLFNSQFLRASCKYVLPYDEANASFVEAGGKYAPSDIVKYKSSQYFLRSELKAYGKLYLGAGLNCMPQRLNKYEGIARYYLTPWNEIFIDYVYSVDPQFAKKSTYTAVGTRLMF